MAIVKRSQVERLGVTTTQKENKTMAINVYEIVTQRILEQMEKGVIPWRKPWKSQGLSELFPCYPYGKKKPYDILNQMLLDFEDGEYATYNQIKSMGGKIKKGEKAHLIVGWIFSKEERKDADGNTLVDEDGNALTKDHYALRYYNVFNVWTQCEGIDKTREPIPVDEDEVILEPSEIAENIINNYVSNETLKFTPKKSDRAFYSPSEDKVVVPKMSQFSDISEYYSTSFHELTHSTMHKDRCNRQEERKGKNVAFGSKEYSKEELVAEIGASALVNFCNLETSASFNNSVSYIEGWSKALKDQPKMIVYASAQAQKAIDYILQYS